MHIINSVVSGLKFAKFLPNVEGIAIDLSIFLILKFLFTISGI